LYKTQSADEVKKSVKDLAPSSQLQSRKRTKKMINNGNTEA